MKQFGESLNEISIERQQRDSIMQKIELLKKQQVVMSFELERNSKRVQEDALDVAYLESLTLASIINAILQNKIETLDREKEILYANQLKLAKLLDEQNRINNELNMLKIALGAYASVDDNYRRLTQEMTLFLLENNSSKASELDKLLKQRSEYERERIYLYESLSEGEEMIKRLDETKRYLVRARNLGTYASSDIGLMTNVKIYHYLDEAQELLHRIQWGLRKFHNSLVALGWYSEKEIASLLKAADYWIDGIFEDYNLQSAISKLIENMNSMMVDILKIDQLLRKGIETSRSKKEAIDRSIKEFFEELTQ